MGWVGLVSWLVGLVSHPEPHTPNLMVEGEPHGGVHSCRSKLGQWLDQLEGVCKR